MQIFMKNLATFIFYKNLAKFLGGGGLTSRMSKKIPQNKGAKFL